NYSSSCTSSCSTTHNTHAHTHTHTHTHTTTCLANSFVALSGKNTDTSHTHTQQHVLLKYFYRSREKTRQVTMATHLKEQEKQTLVTRTVAEGGERDIERKTKGVTSRVLCVCVS